MSSRSTSAWIFACLAALVCALFYLLREDTDDTDDADEQTTPAGRVAKAVTPPRTGSTEAQQTIAQVRARDEWIARKKQILSDPALRDLVAAQNDGSRADIAETIGVEEWFDNLAPEVSAITAGCETFVGESQAPVRITATFVGTKHLGAIVEEIQVEGSPAQPDELTQCLTEGMYTAELTDVPGVFRRDAELTLGGLDELLAMGWLDPEAAEAIRKQMMDAGLDPDTEPAVVIVDAEPESTPSP